MKRTIFILLIAIIACNIQAQDTLYIHQRNNVVTKLPMAELVDLKIKKGILAYSSVDNELNAAYFNKWNGDPTIPYQEYNSNFGITRLWNNKWGAAWTSNDCYATASGGNRTPSITFDLNMYANNATGQGWVIPTKLRIYARYNFNYSSLPKQMRVWGSTSPTVSTTNTEGPDAWVLLSPDKGFLISPPSGQSGLSATLLDKRVVDEDGIELVIRADAPPIRYIRLECVSKWNELTGINSYQIGELKVFGRAFKSIDTLCVKNRNNELFKVEVNKVDSVKFEGPLSPNFAYDIDLNPYRTIKVGNKTWMADNLKTSRFRNGERISNVESNSSWDSYNSSAMCSYNNNPDFVEKYGYLYNLYAVEDARKLAPAGWHVATDKEWAELITALGGSAVAGNKLKEQGNASWLGDNQSATNEIAFNALPAGARNVNDDFVDMGVQAIWWKRVLFSYPSSLPTIQGNAASVSSTSSSVVSGVSVRCVANYAPEFEVSIPTPFENKVSTNLTILADGGETITERGLCWSTSPQPTYADSKIVYTSNTVTTLVTATCPLSLTTYYIRPFVVNAMGVTYGEQFSFTTPDSRVYDIDGNAYNTVKIGTQTWMVEDLKTTRFRNGDPIPNVTDYASWPALTTAAHAKPSATLYNWYAVSDTRNIAPQGWHVPTDAEWATLTAYVGSELLAGAKLKAVGTSVWNSMNTNAKNQYGFTALPTGYINLNNQFLDADNVANWWCVSEYDSTKGIYRYIKSSSESVVSGAFNKASGMAVRCIKD